MMLTMAKRAFPDARAGWLTKGSLSYFGGGRNSRFLSNKVHDVYAGPPVATQDELDLLSRLEKKLIWLSTYMIHNANNIRPKRDGLKVGGHQASSTSLSTIMTALYYKALQPHDRVAVKPHASPMFHAIQYMNGKQTKEKLMNFRGFKGVQSYPSRTKDVGADVDFSTGSVGLGLAITTFSSLIQDYLMAKGLTPLLQEGRSRPGRMICIAGDAELDEGNVYEALLEGWKYGVHNNWWIIDYNRQSLDKVTEEHGHKQVERAFRSHGFNVITLKYGHALREAFARPGGRALRAWINSCDNKTYSALCFQGGKKWRERLIKDIGSEAGVAELLAGYSDAQLYATLTNLGGTCMRTVLEAFAAADNDQPTCFIAYTIKGFGLPMAGHQDNHGLFLNQKQMDELQASAGIPAGQEWEKFSGVGLNDPQQVAALKSLIASAPFNERSAGSAGGDGSGAWLQRRLDDFAPAMAVPNLLALTPSPDKVSTQAHFGQVLLDLAKMKEQMCSRIITMAPDVATSTNLSGFLNERGVFRKHSRLPKDVAKENRVFSVNKWVSSGTGQHFELGIAENNLMIALAAAGMSHTLFGHRLLPVGTLYDPFISRGLDALNYACYMDARFMLVATPSGLSLAPEGGAHQSLYTPLIGMGQPGLASLEPAYADELRVMMQWGFEHMQAPPGQGGAVYLRLSTRQLDQPQREMTEELRSHILAGAYWRGAAPSASTRLVLAFAGCVAPEAEAAAEQLRSQLPADSVALLQVTSPDLLHNAWTTGAGGAAAVAPVRGTAALAAGAASSVGDASHVARMLAAVPRDAAIVTLVDAHPATLAWLGSVHGHRVRALGVNAFGQSGDIPDLFRHYGIDTEAIVAAGKHMVR